MHRLHPHLLSLPLLVCLAACGGGGDAGGARPTTAYLRPVPSLPGGALGITSNQGDHYLIEVLDGQSYSSYVSTIAHELYHAAGNDGHPCGSDDCITGNASPLPAAPCDCEAAPIFASSTTVTVYAHWDIAASAAEAGRWWNDAVGREAFRVLYDPDTVPE